MKIKWTPEDVNKKVQEALQGQGPTAQKQPNVLRNLMARVRRKPAEEQE